VLSFLLYFSPRNLRWKSFCPARNLGKFYLICFFLFGYLRVCVCVCVCVCMCVCVCFSLICPEFVWRGGHLFLVTERERELSVHFQVPFPEGLALGASFLWPRRNGWSQSLRPLIRQALGRASTKHLSLFRTWPPYSKWPHYPINIVWNWPFSLKLKWQSLRYSKVGKAGTVTWRTGERANLAARASYGAYEVLYAGSTEALGKWLEVAGLGLWHQQWGAGGHWKSMQQEVPESDFKCDAWGTCTWPLILAQAEEDFDVPESCESHLYMTTLLWFGSGRPTKGRSVEVLTACLWRYW
jgi:hypothetical protein